MTDEDTNELYRGAVGNASRPPSPAKKLSEWEKITPEHLVPAIKHIRETFDTGVWKCSKVTQKYCYAVLHPRESDPVGIAPYKEALATYRTIIGPAADKRFTDLCRVGTTPALFKAFFEVFLAGLKLEVRNEFEQFLEIGQANATVLDALPVEWAKAQVQNLIKGESSVVRRWIKEVCDRQDLSANVETEGDFDELLYWKTWRCPRLIHMQPSGNTPYDQVTEWTRDDEPRTKSVMESLSQRFLTFLEIDLDKVVGDAYVRLAKNKETTVVPKTESPRLPARVVTQVPPPPTVLRGSSFIPRGPEPSHPLLDFPPYYPNDLQPRTSVVIGEAIKKFPVQTQILDLLKFVISGLTPDFSAAVGEKTLRPDLALTRMGDLIHSLSFHNSAGHSDSFRLEQEARKSDEWLEFAKEIAGGGSVKPENSEISEPAKQLLGGVTQPNLASVHNWVGIEIHFLSDERVQIRNGATTQTLNYEEFGFADSRNGRPNQAWVLLRTLAEKRGIIQNAAAAGQVWVKVEKRIQEIRRVLRAHFGISADPIPFVEGTGYRANFKIGCRRPSFET